MEQKCTMILKCKINSRRCVSVYFLKKNYVFYSLKVKPKVVRPVGHAGGGCSHEVSSMWLPRQDLNRDATNGHANMEGSKLTGPQLRQLWATAES